MIVFLVLSGKAGVLLTIGGECWEKTEHWDCGGADIKATVKPLVGQSGWEQGVAECAEDCANLDNCVGFNYPRGAGNPNCWLKYGQDRRNLQPYTGNTYKQGDSSFTNYNSPPHNSRDTCGAAGTGFDYYTRSFGCPGETYEYMGTGWCIGGENVQAGNEFHYNRVRFTTEAGGGNIYDDVAILKECSGYCSYLLDPETSGSQYYVGFSTARYNTCDCFVRGDGVSADFKQADSIAANGKGFNFGSGYGFNP